MKKTNRFTQADLFKLSNSYIDNYAVAVPQSLIHFTKDYSLAFLISQLLYWSDKTKNPEGYVYKSDREWTLELGVTRRNLEIFRKVCSTAGWMDIKKKMANGHPTFHYKILKKLFDDYELFLNNRQEEIIMKSPIVTSDKSNCNKLQMEMLQVTNGNATSDNSITYNTTYNTHNDTTYKTGENISKIKDSNRTNPVNDNFQDSYNKELIESEQEFYEQEDSLPVDDETINAELEDYTETEVQEDDNYMPSNTETENKTNKEKPKFNSAFHKDKNYDKYRTQPIIPVNDKIEIKEPKYKSPEWFEEQFKKTDERTINNNFDGLLYGKTN